VRDNKVYVYAKVDKVKKISYSRDWIFKRGGSRPGIELSEMLGRHSSVGVVFKITSTSSPATCWFPSPASRARR